jgi:hypothetical protein
MPRGEIKTVVSMTLLRLSKKTKKTHQGRPVSPKVSPSETSFHLPSCLVTVAKHKGDNPCEGVEDSCSSHCSEISDLDGSVDDQEYVLEEYDCDTSSVSTSKIEPPSSAKGTPSCSNTPSIGEEDIKVNKKHTDDGAYYAKHIPEVLPYYCNNHLHPQNVISDDNSSCCKASVNSQRGAVATSIKSKHYEKLKQAKKYRQMSKKLSLENKNKSSWELRMQFTKRVLTCSYAIAFYLWCLWLSIGTVYYIFEENVAFCKGVFISTSIGYGIFWYEQTSTSTLSQVFSLCHYYIGVLAVSFAMAVCARNLNVSKKLWYEDARLLYSMRTASLTSGRWRDVGIYFEYYWPKVYVHVIFVFWMVLGIVWGVCSIKWGVLDAWFFAMTAMAKGGLVALPSSGVHQWDYLFYSVYISVGAPLLAYSCGTAASAISSYGRAQQKEKELNAPMTEDELVMLNHLGVEDNDGFIDGAEFTILLLVRIGALNADLIDVLHDRYYELDADGTGTGVTYEALQNRKSFMNSSRKLSLSTQLSSRGAELVDKLRQRSMGG